MRANIVTRGKPCMPDDQSDYQVSPGRPPLHARFKEVPSGVSRRATRQPRRPPRQEPAGAARQSARRNGLRDDRRTAPQAHQAAITVTVYAISLASSRRPTIKSTVTATPPKVTDNLRGERWSKLVARLHRAPRVADRAERDDPPFPGPARQRGDPHRPGARLQARRDRPSAARDHRLRRRGRCRRPQDL